MYKILIVEDDQVIRDVLSRQLEKWGYLVSAVTDFAGVLDTFAQTQPHLVLLDLSLPFFDGYHWCAQIRAQSQVPIFFISSAQEKMNHVMAMTLGADDFIVKPFDIEVVTAKIGAILRRTYAFGAPQNMVQFGAMTLHLGDGTVQVGQTRVALTKNESKILQVLFEAKGNIVPRERMIAALWADESFVDDNTLTVNITRLRKKLAELGCADAIATRKGVGYCAKISL